jgi:hypothetical protein
MVVHADERVAQGAFRMEDVVVETKDRTHTKRFVEGKHLDIWLPATHKWLEWGTTRAPALFSRPTFKELHEAKEKILVQRSPGPDPKCCYDEAQLHFTESSVGFVPWHALHGVRNNSLKKAARYRGEKPPRHDLPKREELEATSGRFAVKYLLGVMNSSTARDFLRANRRSNIHLYPDDWKKLPIPEIPAAQQQPIVQVVDLILALLRDFHSQPAHRTARDIVLLEFLENLNDALVRELYTPDELHAHSLHFGRLVTEARLPAVTAIRDATHLEEVRKALEKASDINAPLRAALFDLASLALTEKAAETA